MTTHIDERPGQTTTVCRSTDDDLSLGEDVEEVDRPIKGILCRADAPEHWPLSRPWVSSAKSMVVRFPPDDALVTATYTRPRTHVLDIRVLHYTDDEIKSMKRAYKQRKKMQKRRMINDMEIRLLDEQVRSGDCSTDCHSIDQDVSLMTRVKGWYYGASTMGDGMLTLEDTVSEMLHEYSDEECTDSNSDDEESTESPVPSSPQLLSPTAFNSSASQIARNALTLAGFTPEHCYSTSCTKDSASHKEKLMGAPSHWIHCLD